MFEFIWKHLLARQHNNKTFLEWGDLGGCLKLIWKHLLAQVQNIHYEGGNNNIKFVHHEFLIVVKKVTTNLRIFNSKILHT